MNALKGVITAVTIATIQMVHILALVPVAFAYLPMETDATIMSHTRLLLVPLNSTPVM